MSRCLFYRFEPSTVTLFNINKKLYDEINIRITIKNFPHFRRDRQSAHLISGKPNETLYIESPLDQFGLLFTFAK